MSKSINMEEFREGPNDQIKISGRDGTITATKVYTTDEADWLSKVPAIGTSHPEVAGLLLTEISCVRLPGPMRQVTLSYESALSTTELGGSAVQTFYSLDVGVSEEPLLTHPLFAGISDDERTALNSIMSGPTSNEERKELEDLINSAPGGQALSKIKKGITSYLQPTVFWTQQTVSTTLSGFEGVAQTATPPGNPPDLGGGRDWLFLGAVARMTDDGKNWKIERKWQASSRGGWDNDLY